MENKCLRNPRVLSFVFLSNNLRLLTFIFVASIYSPSKIFSASNSANYNYTMDHGEVDTLKKPMLLSALKDLSKKEKSKTLKKLSKEAISTCVWTDDITSNKEKSKKSPWRLFIITSPIEQKTDWDITDPNYKLKWGVGHAYIYCERITSDGKLEFWMADFIPAAPIDDLEEAVYEGINKVIGIVRHSNRLERKIFPHIKSTPVTLQLMHAGSETSFRSMTISDEVEHLLQQKVADDIRDPTPMEFIPSTDTNNCETWIIRLLQSANIAYENLVFGLDQMLYETRKFR